MQKNPFKENETILHKKYIYLTQTLMLQKTNKKQLSELQENPNIPLIYLRIINEATNDANEDILKLSDLLIFLFYFCCGFKQLFFKCPKCFPFDRSFSFSWSVPMVTVKTDFHGKLETQKEKGNFWPKKLHWLLSFLKMYIPCQDELSQRPTSGSKSFQKNREGNQQNKPNDEMRSEVERNLLFVLTHPDIFCFHRNYLHV